MKKEYDFSFSYVQMLPGSNTIENVGFWVFQKGKIFPVAIIELTPYTWRVNNSRLNEEEEKEMKARFTEFSGCNI